MDRKTKLYLNSVTALINQAVTLVCGFILPPCILFYFGTDSYGLMSSITRFLSVISFLELGVGPVIQSNLYKPLAENDEDAVSCIMASAEKFYRRIAHILLAYIAVLAFVFPAISQEFDAVFTVSLLLIISISTFAQYFFGITWQVFLNADQRAYVQTSMHLVTVILNTVLCIGLMKMGYGLRTVMLGSSLVFVLRPLFLNLYVKKHYRINRCIAYDGEPIKQKWNGFAQHLAAVVTEQTAVVMLTFFASYQCVAIYAIYFLVVGGLTNFVMTALSGISAFWGNMLAKKELCSLYKSFAGVECLLHAAVTCLFVITAILIAPFARVYTANVEDNALYYLPMFGVILAFAFGIRCLRAPYFSLVNSAGHYKQTQNGAYISLSINVLISGILVVLFKLSLIGVAVGCLLAMLFHTVYFAWYLRRNIINRPFCYFVKHMLVDIAVGILAFSVTFWLELSMKEVSYAAWVFYALQVSLVVILISMVLYAILYSDEMTYLWKKIRYKKS